MGATTKEAVPAAAGPWAGRKSMRAGESALPGAEIGELESDITGALERDEIVVLFQPQFSCRSGKLVGAEALARWRHPRKQTIGGAAMFEIAARASSETMLSRHIAGEALRAAAGWPGHLGLSLNLTAADLSEPDLVDWMLAAIETYGVPKSRIMVEITERALVHDVDAAAHKLGQLASHGINVALDDFGAGFCNFRYLKRLPIAALKLDRSMIEGIEDDIRDLAILRGILAMAKALELGIVAEGIETLSMRDAVSREGCHVWQGFLGGKPMANDDFCRLAERSPAQ